MADVSVNNKKAKHCFKTERVECDLCGENQLSLFNAKDESGHNQVLCVVCLEKTMEELGFCDYLTEQD